MQEKPKVVTLLNEETGVEDKYLLMPHPLGQGRYAKVYKAQHLKDPSRVFAVKVIRIDCEQVRKEYLKELKIIQNLPDCPNLVKTHRQHLESENNLYIFQEYCESGTLIYYRLQRGEGPLSEDQIYDLFFQTSNGLITLLEAGIVHEDIKPANILKKGKLFKLCDFGVSQIGAECKETTTRKGTISYMPPEKLKSRRFLPNQKSDIYSLGTCIYQVVCGFHPYLKKKTANYKEYLAALEQAKLKPISQIMKLIGSTSLRLENFFKFLERMIDMNPKTRVSLAELKEFIQTTEPFKFMGISEEVPLQYSEAYQVETDQLMNVYESVIRFRKDNEDHLLVTSEKMEDSNSNYSEQKSLENEEHSIEEEVIHQLLLKKRIEQQFNQENAFIVNMLSYLMGGVESIRKCNFSDLNILPTLRNITFVDLTHCKVSRYLKYIVFQFAVALRKRQRQVYEPYLTEEQQQSLSKDQSYLWNQYNKFLIESSFQNKADFGQELGKMEGIELWREISRLLSELVCNLSLVKQNKKEDLLCVLYCCNMPKILQCFSHLQSIFSELPLRDQMIENQEGKAEIEQGKELLGYALEMEPQKIDRLRQEVEKELEIRHIEVLFDIEEDSGEIELIKEELI